MNQQKELFSKQEVPSISSVVLIESALATEFQRIDRWCIGFSSVISAVNKGKEIAFTRTSKVYLIHMKK